MRLVEWWATYNSPVRMMHAYVKGVVQNHPAMVALCGRRMKHLQGPYPSPSMTERSPAGESFCRTCWNRAQAVEKK